MGGFNSVDAVAGLLDCQDMTKSRVPSNLPDFDALMGVTERFEAARHDDPALHGADLDDLLRLVPGQRAICRGNVGGRACIWRIFLTGQEAAASREWNELQRIWPEMKTGRFRVSEPLYHSAEHGILAVEHVPGTPLLQLLWKAAPQEREKWLGPAAKWLRRYTESTESWRPSGPAGWLHRAARGAGKQPFAALKSLEMDILQQLERLAERMEDIEWRVAISHGDYHPNNLIAHKDRLTGIDTGGSARTPIYKDIARFLMHMGRRGLIPSGQRYLGVDRVGLNAFADEFGMSTTERQVIMPFMLGVEALIRVETPALSDSRIRRARRMSSALLDDLKAL